MQKRMRCKAEGEAKYRSNLGVVRILANPTTKQLASFCAPPPRHGYLLILYMASLAAELRSAFILPKFQAKVRSTQRPVVLT